MTIKRISLRFNLDNPEDKAAWEHLHNVKTDSLNKEIISMINAAGHNKELSELLRQTVTVALRGISFEPVKKEPEISESDLAVLDFIDNI